ncbi:long-chain fatty acid transport protein 4-like [Arctopsyche grandis]|uniref:long-chain fatty acid transport protein 4-like n=1 Tax=Arctopsyche grandis TaxID=121162 RepID=UPI00406D9F13
MVDCEETFIPKGMIRLTIVGIMLTVMFSFEFEYASATIILLFTVFLTTSDRPYWIYVISKTFKRDIRLIFRILKVIYTIRGYIKSNMTVPKIFSELVQRHPQKILYHTEEKHWTYKELFDYSNKIGHMLIEFGVRKGDNIGVMLGDGGGAHHPAFWLGSSYIGAPIALIPPQFKSFALINTLKAAKVTYLVYTHHLAEVIKEIQDDPEIKHVKLLQYNIDVEVPMLKNVECVATKLTKMSTAPFTEEIKNNSYSDTFMYIYTSGTTGLPKAVIITHLRFSIFSNVFNKMLNINENDIVYTPLPLHHTAGAVLGASQGLLFGIPVVIRNKFSVSHFWTDCIKYKCTVAQYIGESCRFLLKTAEKSGKTEPAGPHCLRIMVGNGLKSALWKPFQRTFEIPEICELYGATEGNTIMLNIASKVGAIGFIPRFLSFISPMTLIKCDNTTGEPLRGPDGFCIECKPCEAGLLIANSENKMYSFAGYADEESSKKKLLHNVFKSNDLYFNSGDILAMDDFGFLYFKDRIGDTFRWRGENVSTTEVENAIIKLKELDSIVYGVEIPHVEGKAGMAVIIDPERKLDMTYFANDLKRVLPIFAHPLFVRIVSEVTRTSTFKPIKKDFQIESFDITRFKDKVFFLDAYSSSYVPLTEQLYNDILHGKIRL